MRKCPICNSVSYHKINGGEIRLAIPQKWRLPESYNIVSCEQCGFCYANTTASMDDYDAYYTNSNFYGSSPISQSAWDQRNDVAGRVLEEIFDKEARICDMGFGKGVFLEYLRNKGFKHIFGIDPSNESIERMRQKNIPVFRGNIYDMPEKNYQFDCVTCFAVLEHLLVPQKALKALSKYLKEEGYLLINVPDNTRLEGKKTSIITHYFNQEHINYFSIKSLNNLMKRNGFIPVSINREIQDEIVVLYQKKQMEDITYEKDTECEKSIEIYLNRFFEQIHAVESELKCLYDKYNKIYVWGSGTFTMWLLANTILSKFEIEFIDNDPCKQGEHFWNSIIIAPSSISDSERPIVICANLYSEVIKQQIIEMQLQNPILMISKNII